MKKTSSLKVHNKSSCIKEIGIKKRFHLIVKKVCGSLHERYIFPDFKVLRIL
jgi:hypothetical protein